MKKRIISIVLAIMLIMNITTIVPIMSATAAETLQFTANFSKTKLIPGDTVELTVAMTNYSSLTQDAASIIFYVPVDLNLFETPTDANVTTLYTLKNSNNDPAGTTIKMWDNDINKFNLQYALGYEYKTLIVLPKSTTGLFKFTLKVKSTLTVGATYSPSLDNLTVNNTDLLPIETSTTAQTMTIIIPADKTALNAAIAVAQSKKQVDYTPNSWTPFTSELSVAEIVAADITSTQAQVDSETAILNSAVAKLVLRADFTALNAAITTAQSKKQSDYTPNSWTSVNLPNEIAKAQAVFDDKNATQAQVDTATATLNSAMNALVLKPKYMLGDPNNDGKIDGKDIAAIVMHITKVKVITNTDLYPALTAADVNNDGKVDGKDIAAIVMHITKVKQIVQPV